MKDYANRNYGIRASQPEKVPVHWGFIIAALVLMVIIYSIWHHAHKNIAVKPTAVNTTAQQVAAKKPKVKFDFYQMLTQNQAKGQVVGNPTNTPAQAHPNHQYFVQTGSYASKAKALQAKANLILTGASAKLVKLVPGRAGHYRVALGPYTNVTLAQSESKNLKQNGITGLIVQPSDLKS